MNNVSHVKINANNVLILGFSVGSIFQIEFLIDYHVWNHKVNPFEARRCKQSSEMNYPVSRPAKLTDCTLRKEFLIFRKAWSILGEFLKNPFDCSPSARYGS